MTVSTRVNFSPTGQRGKMAGCFNGKLTFTVQLSEPTLAQSHQRGTWISSSLLSNISDVLKGLLVVLSPTNENA